MFRDDPELVGRLKRCLEAEGVEIYEHVKIEEVTPAKGSGISISLSSGEVLEGSHLLAAVGRRLILQGLIWKLPISAIRQKASQQITGLEAQISGYLRLVM